jgi:hypothetical protein
MDNWLADEMLAYEQLREARAAVLIALGERLAQPQERRV